MKPQPLSAETRRQIQVYLEPVGACAVGSAVDLLYKLIAAEQYWREAVKDADLEDPDGLEWCPFCKRSGPRGPGEIRHPPDCPKLLAQE